MKNERYRVGGLTDTTLEEKSVRELYSHMLDAWNHRQADEMAALHTEDASVVGFDGSQMNGRAEIGRELRQIFADHQTAAYFSIIREVRFLSPEVALLRAVVGMVPAGKSELNPAVNAIQSLVAVKSQGSWHIAHFQNTPAQFHGRPDLAQQLTEELQRAVNKQPK